MWFWLWRIWSLVHRQITSTQQSKLVCCRSSLSRPNQNCDDYYKEEPSEILANMRRLAPDPGSESIIHTLFLAEMPASIRPLLTVWEETDLDKLAKIADKMLEAVNTNASLAIGTSPSFVPPASPVICAVSPADPLKELSDNLRSLLQDVTALKKDVKRIQSRNRSRSSSRGARPAGNSGQQTSGAQENLCFYHKRFGDNANKCRPPCARSTSLN